jgi:hypothetical protein
MLQGIYTCSHCSTQDKRERGCKKKRRQTVAHITCVCEGKTECKLCLGSNRINVHRCPRAILLQREVSRVAPYFTLWQQSGMHEYPDGRGRYFQPLKMLEAFHILLLVKTINAPKAKQWERP